ncbi:MAG: hypothetical protein HPY65_13765 [Syntrophaceae bacterium]|nr:hypothetical protein [Syntrophaceae bacterium]
MSEIDLKKVQRESTRWLILATLDAARPIGANERLILSTVQEVIRDVTLLDIRRELDYLDHRKLLEIKGKDTCHGWTAELTRDGIDVVEYTVECDPGIARPKKWW